MVYHENGGASLKPETDGFSSGLSASQPIRLIIADYYAMFRQGLRSLLEAQPDMTVVAEVERVEDLRPTLSDTPCDILLLELQMDRWMMGEIESLSRTVAVAVLTVSDCAEDAIAAFRVGARAVIRKHHRAETLITALRSLASGNLWIPAELQSEFLGRLRETTRAGLTERESEVVRLVARGFRNAEIASRLSISESTVKTHLNNIFQKLELRDRTQLVRYALRIGMAPLGD